MVSQYTGVWNVVFTVTEGLYGSLMSIVSQTKKFSSEWTKEIVTWKNTVTETTVLRSYRTSPFPAKRYCVGYMPGTRRQGGQRKQWVNDITDWAGMSLPEIVTLARERWQYRQIVHKVANAPHGVWHTNGQRDCSLMTHAQTWAAILMLCAWSVSPAVGISMIRRSPASLQSSTNVFIMQRRHGVHTLQPVAQPVGWTMQMSRAKRRLSGPARTFMASLRHSKAAAWTVDDVARLIEWIFKTFPPTGCTTGCKVYTHFDCSCSCTCLSLSLPVVLMFLFCLCY